MARRQPLAERRPFGVAQGDQVLLAHGRSIARGGGARRGRRPPALTNGAMRSIVAANRCVPCSVRKESAMAAATEVVLTTCPRDCYDSCGVAVVKRDGAIAQVRGDPNHPVSRGKLC